GRRKDRRTPELSTTELRFDTRLRRERPPAAQLGARLPVPPSMIARNLAALLFLAALVRPASPLAHSGALATAGLQQDNLSALVAGEVSSAAQKDLPSLWKRAVALRDAEALGEKGALDRALDEWLAKGSELSPRAALLVSASRLLGTAPEVTRVAEAL